MIVLIMNHGCILSSQYDACAEVKAKKLLNTPEGEAALKTVMTGTPEYLAQLN